MATAEPTAPPPPANPAGSLPANRSRLQSLAPILLFDIAGPLVVYTLLRSNGSSTVVALVVSGILPASGVILRFGRQRRLDVIGLLVLSGIAVGATVALISGNARLVLLEGSVPTAVFGFACLISLRTSRPLIYRFALEGIGHDTPNGRDFAGRWRYATFRRTFRVITAVWGIAYLAEAVARVIIVESTSTGTAFTISKVMPYAVAGVVLAWMIPYSLRAKRRGEARLAELAGRPGPPPADARPGVTSGSKPV